jgi:hypothetical protein
VTELSPAYDALTEEQKVLVDGLLDEHRPELERLALLQILLEPGFEEAFLVRYFGHRLDAMLEDFHIRLIDTALNDPRGLVLFPAQHGKTTIISTMLPILAALRNPNIRIAIIAKNDDEAAAIMSSIKSELEQNELLIADYGPFRPEAGDPMRSWSAGAISIAARTRLGKEHTITVFGAGSRQILGWRTDWVICDDVVTEKNSATEDQRAKHVTWFNDCVSTSPHKKFAGQIAGRITVVGTMFHPRDLYATITEKRKRGGEAMYHTHREDAVRSWDEQQPLWPAVWSWEDLMDIKTSEGTLSFNKRYRNKPVDESEQPFREDWLRGGGNLPNGARHPGCVNPTRVLGDLNEVADSGWSVIQSFDPAVGKTKSAKFCGHIVFGIDKADPRRRYLIEINREQLTLPQQVDLIIQTHLKYQATLSVTESNAYQAGLEQAIAEKCEQMGVTIRIEGHTTGLNKQDPEIGIPSLSPVVENGYLDIPYGNAESMRKAEMLLEELIEYPFFKYSDLLMALWFGHLKSNHAVPGGWSMNRLSPKSRYRRKNGRRGLVHNPYFANQGVQTAEPVPSNP